MDFVTTNSVKIDALGRLVVPKDLRNAMGFTPGSMVSVAYDGESLRIRKLSEQDSVTRRLDELCGAVDTLSKARPDVAIRLNEHIEQMRFIVEEAYGRPTDQDN